jgi:hypothetical protein
MYTKCNLSYNKNIVFLPFVKCALKVILFDKLKQLYRMSTEKYENVEVPMNIRHMALLGALLALTTLIKANYNDVVAKIKILSAQANELKKEFEKQPEATQEQQERKRVIISAVDKALADDLPVLMEKINKNCNAYLDTLWMVDAKNGSAVKGDAARALLKKVEDCCHLSQLILNKGTEESAAHIIKFRTRAENEWGFYYPYVRYKVTVAELESILERLR